MTKNFLETVQNGIKYYSDSKHSHVAKMMNQCGFIYRIDFEERTYFSETIIDQNAELVFVEVSPCIYCCKASRSQVGEYIDKINSFYKNCNIRISENGNLYMHTEQRFSDAPLTPEMFKKLEEDCLRKISVFETILDKLAHLKLLDPEEANVDAVIEKTLRKRTAEYYKSLLTTDDEDEDCDETEAPYDSEKLDRLFRLRKAMCDAQYGESKSSDKKITPELLLKALHGINDDDDSTEDAEAEKTDNNDGKTDTD